jgi:hypothetical protein
MHRNLDSKHRVNLDSLGGGELVHNMTFTVWSIQPTRLNPARSQLFRWCPFFHLHKRNDKSRIALGRWQSFCIYNTATDFIKYIDHKCQVRSHLLSLLRPLTQH